MKVKVNGVFVDVGGSSGGGDLSTAITIAPTQPEEPTPIWVKTPN